MVKKIYAFHLIFILVIFLCLSKFSLAITGDTITGELVTGNATSQQLAISISVISTNPPTIVIDKPQNGIYLTNLNLPLNYTISNPDSIWYNLDLGSNTTLTENSFFNTTEGPHVLYLYANNSYGESSENVSFNVNLSIFSARYDSWKGEGRQGSTDFNESSFEELQSLENIIFNHVSYGKIKFLQIINVTNSLNASDGFVDLDEYVSVSSNRIEVNSTALPNLNKSATLSLRGLGFSNPRILKDGQVCSSTICTIESYSGGVLKFNVTMFSIYSAEETPSDGEGSSGGGGGTKSTVEEDIEFNVDLFKLKVSQGHSEEQDLIITNNGPSKIDFSLEIEESVDVFLDLDYSDFSIDPGEIKIIPISVFASPSTIPNLYFGKLIFKSKMFSKELPVLVEVESSDPLFDVGLKIPKQFKNIKPGEDFLVLVDIFNLGDGEVGRDVVLEFSIKDSEGKTVLKKENSVAIETSVSHSELITLPGDIEIGMYVVYVKVLYVDKIASASGTFYVEKISLRSFFKNNLFWLFVGAFCFILLVAVYIFIKRRIDKNKQEVFNVNLKHHRLKN